MAGYARDQFGSCWVDVNRIGCDTSDDILRRDLKRRRVRLGTRGCVITRGVLTDPYTRRHQAQRARAHLARRVVWLQAKADNKHGGQLPA